MAARSDAAAIGPSLRYRQYARSQGFTPFLIVLELVLVLDAFGWSVQMQSRVFLCSPVSSGASLFNQEGSKIEFEHEDDNGER